MNLDSPCKGCSCKSCNGTCATKRFWRAEVYGELYAQGKTVEEAKAYMAYLEGQTDPRD